MNKEVGLKVKLDEARTAKYFQPVITNNTVIIPAKKLQEDLDISDDKSPVYKNIVSEEKIEASLAKSVDKPVKEINIETSLTNPVEDVNFDMSLTEPTEAVSFDMSLTESAEDINFDMSFMDSVPEHVEEVKAEEVSEDRQRKIDEVKAALLQSVQADFGVFTKVNEDEFKLDELKIEEIVIEEATNDLMNEESNSGYRMKIEDMAKLFEMNQADEVNGYSQQPDASYNQLAGILTTNGQQEQTEQEQAYQVKAEEKDITRKMDLPFLENKQTESMPQRKEVVDNLSEMKIRLFLLASNAKRPVRICVNKKVFTMGSDYARMDCVIRNNRYVSRCHARIYYESGCYFLEDAGSMNGTYINGVKLAEGIKYKLETADVINLADCKFEVDIKG